MIEQTSQGGNSHPGHSLFYQAELTPDRQFRVQCSVCTHYIRLTLGNFFQLQQSRQTYSFFEAMAGECKGAKEGAEGLLVAFIASALETIRQEPDEAKALKQMESLKAILKGAK